MRNQVRRVPQVSFGLGARENRIPVLLNTFLLRPQKRGLQTSTLFPFLFPKPPLASLRQRLNVKTTQPFSTASQTTRIDRDNWKIVTPKDTKALRFVFLEGEAATGKSTICQILKSRGYTVQFEDFVELCKLNSRYNPQGSIVSIKWVCSQFLAMERFIQQHEENLTNNQKNNNTNPPLNLLEDNNLSKKLFKGNIVFFDRSLLTPYVYVRNGLNNFYVRDAMMEIRKTFPCVAFLCKTNRETIVTRLKSRYGQTDDDQTKDIRKSLGELDLSYVDYIHDRYLQLEREGWFDDILDTTAPDAQVVDNLLLKLQTYGLLQKDD